ncbi:MAG: hypothetical protein Q4F21_01965 [Lachnospiraceae bacterium]|nr:hypothetical protein [Lachnospiraceae bacterium]
MGVFNEFLMFFIKKKFINDTVDSEECLQQFKHMEAIVNSIEIMLETIDI